MAKKLDRSIEGRAQVAVDAWTVMGNATSRDKQQEARAAFNQAMRDLEEALMPAEEPKAADG